MRDWQREANSIPLFCLESCFLSRTTNFKAGTAGFGQLVFKSCSNKMSCGVVLGVLSSVQKVSQRMASVQSHKVCLEGHEGGKHCEVSRNVTPVVPSPDRWMLQ